MEEMRIYEHRGLHLEYQITGNGTPVIFLHGMGGGLGQIRSVYDKTEGIRLIIPVMQGHGGSEADWEHYDFDHLGDDVTALMDGLGLQKAMLAGISMGAGTALNIAIRHPERVTSLLLIRNAWTDRPMEPDVVQAYEDLGRCLREGGLKAFQKTPGWEIVKEPSAYTRSAFTRPFTDPTEQKNWQKYLILPRRIPIRDKAELKHLRMPVRILANRHDLCHPFRYGEWMQQQIPGAVLTEIPDKDTDPAEHRRQVNEALRDLAQQSSHK